MNIIDKFKNLSLKTQATIIMVPLVVVFVFGMSLFYILYERIKLVDDEVLKVEAIAKSISTSSAIWLESNDFGVIQDIIETQKFTRDIDFVSVSDSDGLIVAHTDLTKKGLYLKKDVITNSGSEENIITKGINKIRISYPIYINNAAIGYVVISSTPNNVMDRIEEIINFSILAALIFIVIGVLLFNKFINRIIGDIYKIVKVSEAVSKEDISHRVLLDNESELGVLAKSFNYMLETISYSYEQLKDSENKFAEIAGSVSNVFWVENPKSNMFEYVSPAFKKIWGVDEIIVQGNPFFWENSIHVEDRSFVAGQLQNLIVPKEYEYRIVIKSEILWIKEVAYPIYDEHNELLRIIRVSEDVTEKKLLESQLKEQIDRANLATNAKSQFLANMSHEIRTPMNAIIGFLTILKDTELNSEQAEYVNTTLNSSNVLLGIINDILDLSKIESGKMEISEGIYDIKATTLDMVNMFIVRAKDKGIDIRHNIDMSVPRYIKSDELKYKQIINNLLSNAFKFTESGSILVDMSFANNTITMSVIDTGIGMSQIAIKNLFQAFNQADITITRRYGGTGLGLNITKKYIELMGGNISVESRVGHGTKFVFNIKVSVPSLDEIKIYEDSVKKISRKDDSIFKGLNVLLVEDNNLNQMVAKKFLMKLGCVVEIADNGAECISKLDVIPVPSVILMDVQMPIMDGFTATKILKANSKYANIPIIAMTAAAMQHDERECYAAGMDGFVPKPIDPDVLINSMLKLLNSDDFDKKQNITNIKEMDNVVKEEKMNNTSWSFDKLHASLLGFDLKNIEQMLSGDSDLYVEMIQTFANDYSSDWHKIVELIKSGEFQPAHKLLHMHKGAIGNLGGLKMHSACQRLDTELKQNGYSQDALNDFISNSNEIIDNFKKIGFL